MTTFLEYAERGKNAWWRYVAAIVLSAGLIVGVFAALIVALLFAHADTNAITSGLQQPTHPVVFFASTGVMFGIVLLCIMGAIRLVHGKRFTDIIGRWPWRLFLLGASLWLAIEAASTFVDFLIAPGAFRITATLATAPLVLAALLGLAVQTFSEEFVFRGYLTQGLLLLTKRPNLTAVVSGVIFGSLHIPNGLPQAAGAVCFGVATAFIAIRTGGLAFTYGMHLINNLFGAVFVVSSSDVFSGSPGLLTQSTPQLVWWDDGVGVVALLLVAWLVVRFATVTSAPAAAPA